MVVDCHGRDFSQNLPDVGVSNINVLSALMAGFVQCMFLPQWGKSTGKVTATQRVSYKTVRPFILKLPLVVVVGNNTQLSTL